MNEYNFTDTKCNPLTDIIGPGNDDYGRARHFGPGISHSLSNVNKPEDKPEKTPYLDSEVIEVIRMVLDMHNRILDYNDRLIILLEKYKK